MLDETKTLKKIAFLKAKQLELIPKIQKESKHIDLHTIFRIKNMCKEYLLLELKSDVLIDILSKP